MVIVIHTFYQACDGDQLVAKSSIIVANYYSAIPIGIAARVVPQSNGISNQCQKSAGLQRKWSKCNLLLALRNVRNMLAYGLRAMA